MKLWRSPRLTLLPLLFLSFFMAACGSTAAGPSTDRNQAGDVVKDKDLCAQSLDFEIFQLEPAGRVATLGDDFEFGTLGHQGALDVASEMFSLEGSFCAFEVPADLAEALDEVDQLFESGQDSLADDKLSELLADVEREAFSSEGSLKVALPRLQQGGAQARKTVRSYLAIAARAQYWGNNERADDAIASATDTFEAWASDAVDSADLKEALRIAAEAQLLGLLELGDEAIARATDLAETALVQALEVFNPCLASLQEARSLLRAIARAMLFGIETFEYGAMDEINEWKDIRLRRQRGEDVPECESWQVNLNLDTVWDSGQHTIAWEGFFIVQENDELDGQGTGRLVTHVETICVNLLSGEEFISTTDVTGTFNFEIQGKQETRGNANVFKFQFPAEVTLSGTDTCNPFDKTTYLPKYVIEEIHSSGGVEGYDMITDQIYLVVPAMDGATQVYETVIGPVTLTLTEPGTVE
ncbi:MAG: hypothetical protein E3J69_08345 [Anaerolineales bacterium]|nr:MAG: hypothetical protein E3J69_08345 [Anaerolineales bacterium]